MKKKTLVASLCIAGAGLALAVGITSWTSCATPMCETKGEAGRGWYVRTQPRSWPAGRTRAGG